jgi:hypothetical protein
MEWVAQNTQYLSGWDPVVANEGDLLRIMQEVMRLESMEKKPLGIIFDNRLNEASRID